MNITIIMK